MRVLTTNPGYRNTTALVRAVGRQGAQVEVLGFLNRHDKPEDGQAFHSRYCCGRHFVRDPRRDLDAFADDLEALLRRERFDAILPVSTNTVLPISKFADRLRPLAPFPFPDYDSVECAHNKLSMIRVAEDANVGVPYTVVIESEETIERHLDEYTFPVIVKTRKGGGSNGVFPARDRDALIEIIRRLEVKPLSDADGVCNDSSNPMLQEMVPGRIYDVPFLARDGEILAHVVQYRERMLPVDGGAGMINRTCDHEPSREAAFKLVRALRWTGIGLVEFKLDAEGQPRLMELNPKFWGTLDLSIQAGVNFPWLSLLLTTGQDVPRTDYRRGVRYRWVFPDGVRTVQASSDRVRASYEFFWPFRRHTKSEIRLTDLGPTGYAVRGLLRR